MKARYSDLLLRRLRPTKADRRILEEELEPPDRRELFVVDLPVSDHIRRWFQPRDVHAAIQEAAVEVLARFERTPPSPAQVLASPGSLEEKRKAGHSMLAKRGGKATAAKMRSAGFPNLVKARAARCRKAAQPPGIPREYLPVNPHAPAGSTADCPGCYRKFELSYMGQPACSNACAEKVRRALGK